MNPGTDLRGVNACAGGPKVRSFATLRSVLRAVVGVLAWSAVASAQPNIAPIARLSLAPDQVFVGEPIAFRGSDSVDPDDGPSPLTYAWDFGDGSTSTEADPTHAYAAPDAYTVTLTVRDGATQSLVTALAHVLAMPTPTLPSRSSMLWIDRRASWLWAVNPDSGSVSVVDLATASRLSEIELGGRPISIAGNDQGVFVVDEARGRVIRLDARRFTVEGHVDVGLGPRGIAASLDALFVAVRSEDRVVRLDAAGGSIERSWEVADSPHALALTHDGTRVLVSHFLSRDQAQLTAIAPDSDRVEVVELAIDPGPDRVTSGRGMPNLLGAIAIEPSGQRVWLGGLKSNVERGTYLSGEPFPFTNRVRALFAPVDLDVDGLRDRVDRRIDPNDSDSVSAIQIDAAGRWAYVAHPGAGSVSIFDLSSARLFVRGESGDTVPFVRFDVGDTPRALALSADERTLYVLNELSRSLQVVDVSDRAAPVVAGEIPLTDEPLSADVALGKRLFHRSRLPVHSQDNYIACASCHPDGGHDGQTWDFTQFGEGLRNTIDLRGRAGLGHGALHWSANFDEVQDFENDIVNGFGGTGLAMDGMSPHPPMGTPNAGRSAELDALAAYLTSLGEVPPSPHRGADGFMTEAGLRGREIFARAGCPTCHAAPRFTNSTLEGELYDVGTLREGSGMRLGEPLTGIDTPTLLGLWDGAPYLHDGRATLRAVLVEENADGRHGSTADLDASELEDLVAYLLQLDGRPDEPSVEPDAGMMDAGQPDASTSGTGGGCGCRTSDAASWMWMWGLLLWFGRRR